MICYCPYCSKELNKALVNGVSFCDKCERTILSTKENELLSAYRVLKNKLYTNLNQMKFLMRISNKDFEFLSHCHEEGYSMDEFIKKLKKEFISNA